TFNTPQDRARDLITTVLQSSATKRDARQYLQRFGRDDEENVQLSTALEVEHHAKVPAFFSPQEIKAFANELNPGFRSAIFKVRNFDQHHPTTLQQLAATVLKLNTLGLRSILVVDADTSSVNRFISNSTSRHRFRLLDGIFDETDHLDLPPVSPAPVSFDLASLIPLDVALPKRLIHPLARDAIPVITNAVYSSARNVYVRSDLNSVVLALAKMLTKYHIPVDKTIFVEPLGGVPSSERNLGAHFFINLLQEYDEIISELTSLAGSKLSQEDVNIHIENVKAMFAVLSVLPTTSTGIITTPEIAIGNSTRNPVVYNLLTDRPIASPSLPLDNSRTPTLNTTILRRGMPLKIIRADYNSGFSLRNCNEINLDLLIKMLEDSFGKKLDVESYLSRVDNNVAAVILAIDSDNTYAGGAIITYEEANSSGKIVPYLDKIGVAKSAQGSTGVADIVFKAMVLRLFPDEVIWRSRKTNPVNKWYFERCKGSYKIPNSNWCAFWAG
ncbi:hypothetical protein CANCADRAFT_17154, partial [Tortispora caseinolytica NRRL Y-17796]